MFFNPGTMNILRRINFRTRNRSNTVSIAQSNTFSNNGATNIEFKYKSLKDSEIRVFRLLPRTQGRDICGTIEHINLADTPSPKYQTLSYVWGDPNITTPVKIRYGDDNSSIFHQFQATTNLALALEHMRSDSTSPVIWIDALCINQSDVDEWNRQVARMGEIYSKCTQVNIWLGPLQEKVIPNRRISQVSDYKDSLIQKQSKWHCEPTREWTH
jgi:hypothetical protein